MRKLWVCLWFMSLILRIQTSVFRIYANYDLSHVKQISRINDVSTNEIKTSSTVFDDQHQDNKGVEVQTTTPFSFDPYTKNMFTQKFADKIRMKFGKTSNMDVNLGSESVLANGVEEKTTLPVYQNPVMTQSTDDKTASEPSYTSESIPETTTIFDPIVIQDDDQLEAAANESTSFELAEPSSYASTTTYSNSESLNAETYDVIKIPKNLSASEATREKYDIIRIDEVTAGTLTGEDNFDIIRIDEKPIVDAQTTQDNYDIVRIEEKATTQPLKTVESLHNIRNDNTTDTNET